MSLYTQRGVSLIEVLIAVLITATGVLGASALQLNSVKFNQVANIRSAAVFLSNDITDRMRANRVLALAGRYDIAIDDDAPEGDTIVDIDLQEWLAELALRLPEGDGAISRDGSVVTVTVQWDEGRLSKSRLAGGGNIQSFVFVTEF
ncbi:type IV pilus modification protein PilV [Zhongshania sp.]|jgi:type IV pilus assembly protein PilV|uniref:type IV pilus modification protein PilV n=1 Tax=Zhongshania sp. TaxID=1971902 RepID=UPI002A80F93D|nr:type IV pilus modification protein PilV [Zhongshania sp.]